MRNRIREVPLSKGMTIVEMVMAMAIMTIVFAALLPQFRAIQNSWGSKADNAETLQNSRVLMDHLSRNLSKAARLTAVSGPSVTNGYVEFKDNGGNILRYDISNNNYVEFGPVGNLSELAGPVSQLKFTCYDACDLGSPTTDVNKIRNIKFNATFPALSLLSHDRIFSGQAYLRSNTISLGSQLCPGVAVSDEIVVEGWDWGGGGRIDALSGGAVVSTNSTGGYKVIVKDMGVIDGDVLVGPGGNPFWVIWLGGWGQITGSRGVLSQAINIPLPIAPSMGSSVGDKTYSSGTTYISSNLHCDKFKIRSSAIVQISGNVIILAEDDFIIEDWGKLKLDPAATLTLYTKDNFEAFDSAEVNVNTADPSRLMINHLCGDQIELADSSRLYATIIAPYAQLYIRNSARFYGSFKGGDVRVTDTARLYAVSGGTIEQILP